jgi:hypothetical protein
VERHEDGAVRTSVETEPTISHFIPSVELTGSRSEKLRKLDTLILYLEKLRGSLASDTTKASRPSHERARPAWGWFTAGIVVGAVAVLLLFAVGYWAL